jgi:hypothetical protein
MKKAKSNEEGYPIVTIFIVAALLLAFSSFPMAGGAGNAPLIHHASVQPTKVYPGDTMTVTAEVSDPSGIESVTADMGGIETISLNLVEGSVYHGTWQGQWLVHDTTARDYVTTIVATNSRGKSSATDIVWRDPQTYERYHIQNLTLQETTDTNWVDALTLTFTPNVAGDFLILIYATLGNSSVSYYTEWQAIYDSTVIAYGSIAPVTVEERATAGASEILTLSKQQYNFKIQYRTSNALGTASITNCSLAAVSISDYHHNDGTDSSTTAETYQDETTLTFTPASEGDYLVLASMEIANSLITESTYVQLIGGPTGSEVSWGEVVRMPPVALQYASYAVTRKATLTAASHTFKIQYRRQTAGSGTAYIRNAHLAAVRLSDLGDAEYAESEAESTTKTIDYSAIKTTKSFDHTTCENHLLIAFALMKGDVTNKNFFSASYIDGVLEDERIMRPNAVTDYRPLYAAEHHYFSSASHTLDIRFKSELTSRTNTIKNARILSIRMDTLTPFSDSGHTAYCNNFNEFAKSTVYIQGCYFEVSTAYHVAYYDNGGDKILSDGVSSGVNGAVDSQCYFRDYPSSAAGTWHAVIYKDSVSAPPETYSANDANSTRECAFTVTVDAIPEFPTVMAAIGVAGLCFGIYWWIKKRACGVR